MILKPYIADSQVCLDEPPEFNQVNILKDRSFYKLLMHDLENFVSKAQGVDDLYISSYSDRFRKITYKPSQLANLYFRRIPEFVKTVGLLPSAYSYDESIEVFISCCKALNLIGSDALLSDYWNANSNIAFHAANATSINIYNDLVSILKSETRRLDVQKRKAVRLRIFNRQYVNYCKYINKIFDTCARLVIIRIDLFYKKKLASSVTIDRAQSDIDHLLRNKRHNSIFGHMKGYIVKMEYGIDKGIHFHALLLFDGSRRSNHSHIHIAQLIGKYWVDVITKGRGDYWNSNAKIKDFKGAGLCGIGTINADETILRYNLLNHVVKYLCKPSQYFKPKIGPEVRLFRRGRSPKVSLTKRGRPRGRRQTASGEAAD